MKKRLLIIVIGLLVIPTILGLVLAGLAIFPANTPEPLRPPKAEPIAGYDIFYPYMVNGSQPDKGTFFYVSTKRQVIYRYDAERYLELQGENCSGLIWYHDDKNNIHTRIERQFYSREQLPSYAYFNPGKNYIAIPKNDLSDFVFSIDGGRTFMDAIMTAYSAVPGDEVAYFIGVDETPIEAEYRDVDKYMQRVIRTHIIAGSTGYFILKNGDILFGKSDFYDQIKVTNSFDPTRIAYNYDQRYLPYSWLLSEEKRLKLGLGVYYDIYQNPTYLERIESIKDIKSEPYQGWDHIRCEVGAER